MLTLREPIKLHISDGLPTVSDAFYERIAGAYGVLQAEITPKELLFCLSTPFELPDELGGLTTVAVANSYSDRRSVTMELVTNVLNRILLSTTPEFAYQDQVYIDSVLYKLGVEDVPLFMKQVQKLSDEHLTVERLVALYRQELSLRGQQAEGAGEPAAQPAALPAGEPAAQEPERLYLHREIYDRLETRELYELVNRFQTDSSRSVASFRQSELKTTEQLSVSRLLALGELRETTAALPRVELYHTVNRFELGDLLPAPQTSGQVLSQAAEAALLASFEHVFTQRLADRITRTNTWLRLERVLGETVENSVARFQSFHAENSFFFRENTTAPESVERIREETDVLRELIETRTALGGVLALSRRLRESAAVPPPALVNPPVEAQGELVTEERETEHTETTKETSVTRDVAELTRLALAHGAAPAPAAPKKPAEPAPAAMSFRTVREVELRGEIERQTELLRETLREQRTLELQNTEIPAARAGTETVSETLRELRERTERSARQTRTQENTLETLLQNPPAAAAAAEPAAQNAAAPGPSSAETGPAAETVQGAVPEAPDAVLERELRELNEKNREKFETLQIEHLHTAETAPPVMDTKKTIEISRRALETPETVLRELRGNGENGAPRGTLSPEAKLLLEHADPATRAVLEAALGRGNGGESGAGAPAFREGSPGEFNAAAMEILRQAAPAPEAFPSETGQLPPEAAAKTLLERAGTPAPAAAAAQRQMPAPLPKLSLVHRREQETLSDELLERLENRSVNATEQTDVFETQTDRRIEEFNNTGTTTRLTTQTTEDVTELVNRTLARQMNEISDKVYRQMEKRLQTERSRRGRF